jgi:hypothetical protein
VSGETDGPGTCAYSLDVTEWNGTVSDWYDKSYHGDANDGPGVDARFLDDDGQWHCHRRTRPTDDYCVFHAHESDGGVECDTQRDQVLLDIVNGETADRPWNRGEDPDGLWEVHERPEFGRDEFKRREKQFIGAALGDVMLSYERLDGPDSYPIDLRLARVERVDLSRARVEHPLWLAGIEQTGEPDEDEHGLNFWRTRFASTLGLVDAESTGGVDLTNVEAVAVLLNHASVDDVSAYRVTVDDVQLIDTSVDGTAALSGSDLRNSVRCQEAAITGDVSLDRVDVGSNVLLDDAEIDGAVSIEDASIVGSVKGKRTSVDGRVSIDRSEVGYQIRLEGAEIGGGISIDDASTGASVFGDGVHVVGDTSLSRSEFGNDVRLNDVDIEGDVSIERASAGDVGITGTAEVHGDVSFENSSIDANVFLNDASVGGSVSFHRIRVGSSIQLIDATVGGDVSLDVATVEFGVSMKRIHVRSGDVSLDFADLGQEFDLFGGEVGGDVSLKSTVVGNQNDVRFTWARIHGSVEFDGAHVDSSVKLDVARVGGSLSIDQTDVGDEILITKRQAKRGNWLPARIGGRLAVEETTTPRLAIDCVLTHPGVDAVSLRGSTVTEGMTLHVRADEAGEGTVYDLAGATIGDIEPYVSDDIERTFEHLRFLDTTFDGFVFSRKRKELREIDWAVHRPREGGYEDIAVVVQSVHPNRDESVAFDVARELAASLAVCSVVELVDGDAWIGDDGDYVGALVERHGDRLGEDGILNPQLLVEYARGWTGAASTSAPRGDPVSWLSALVGIRTAADHGRLRSSAGREAVGKHAREVADAIRDTLPLERIRRAARSTRSATQRREQCHERLLNSVSDPVTTEGLRLQAVRDGGGWMLPQEAAMGGQPGPLRRFDLPEQLGVSDGETVTAEHLARGVAETLSRTPAIVRDVIETERTDERALARTTRVDGKLSAPVRAIRAEWDLPVESPLVVALAGAGESIVEAATTIQRDHDDLVGTGLATDEATADVTDDGAHPYSAVADAIRNPESVARAETLASMASRPDAVDRELFERVDDWMDDDGWLSNLEASIARDLADPEGMRGTNEQLESTYAETKNGASEAGDETAAGHFFQREAAYSRYQHWYRWCPFGSTVLGIAQLAVVVVAALFGALYLGGDVTGIPALVGRLLLVPDEWLPLLMGVLAVGVGVALLLQEGGREWLGNAFLWATMGYGERPLRVLGFSIVIVVLFALGYRAAGVDHGVGVAAGNDLIGYLILSLELFVTIVLGTPEFDDPWIQFAAGLEGFLGVFVIGMFVVTVTRAVHR